MGWEGGERWEEGPTKDDQGVLGNDVGLVLLEEVLGPVRLALVRAGEDEVVQVRVVLCCLEGEGERVSWVDEWMEKGLPFVPFRTSKSLVKEWWAKVCWWYQRNGEAMREMPRPQSWFTQGRWEQAKWEPSWPMAPINHDAREKTKRAAQLPRRKPR